MEMENLNGLMEGIILENSIIANYKDKANYYGLINVEQREFTKENFKQTCFMDLGRCFGLTETYTKVFKYSYLLLTFTQF